MPTPEQKKEYNKKYREKQKQKDSQSEPDIEIEKNYIQVEQHVSPVEKPISPISKEQPPEEIENAEEIETDGETFIIDKKTYEYLIAQAKKGQLLDQIKNQKENEKPKEIEKEKPKEIEKEKTEEQATKKEQPNDDIFFLLKKQLKLSIIGGLASVATGLALHSMMRGGQYFMNSTKYIPSSNISIQPKESSAPLSQEYAVRTVNLA